MAAAAQHVMQALQSGWKEYPFGRLEKQDTAVAQAWDRGRSVIPVLRDTAAAHPPVTPIVVAHNLDMMCDAHGHVLQDPSVQLALHSLVEATRGGVVIGLADQDGPRLAT